jgi:hypothetical protein
MRAFAHGIWGELQDRLVEGFAFAVAIGMLVLSSGFSVTRIIEDKHKAIIAGVWLFAAIIIYHSFRAAYSVAREIKQEEIAHLERSHFQKFCHRPDRLYPFNRIFYTQGPILNFMRLPLG